MSSRIFNGSFSGPQEESSGSGKRPVVFDIIGPDGVTSLLPEGLRLVLHVNPSEMKFTYSKIIERIQTKGGWVEQHYGEGADSISCSASSGGFMRLYTGLSNVTGGPGSINLGGGRRETLAYDTYLDLLALFHNNGSIYDSRGNIVFQGWIKCSFDGGVWTGWFTDFNVEESADKPYQFQLSWNYTVEHEFYVMRTTRTQSDDNYSSENPLEEQRASVAEIQAEREARQESFLPDSFSDRPSTTTPGFEEVESAEEYPPLPDNVA